VCGFLGAYGPLPAQPAQQLFVKAAGVLGRARSGVFNFSPATSRAPLAALLLRLPVLPVGRFSAWAFFVVCAAVRYGGIRAPLVHTRLALEALSVRRSCQLCTPLKMPLELKLVVAHLLIAALAHALFGLSHAPSARAIACLVLAFLALEFCQLSHYRPFVLAAAWSSAVLLALTASSARQSSPFEGNLLLIILCSGFGLLCADSLFSAVFCFELMTAGALSLLKMHSKYDRSAEALFEMYVWAMLGSSCLVLSLVLVAFCPTLSVAEPLAAVGLILAAVGFMIKIPM
jgi:formate hydrogenlyase subunit 3/multisubunit Na+/H+ antiporter MnhD subunit